MLRTPVLLIEGFFARDVFVCLERPSGALLLEVPGHDSGVEIKVDAVRIQFPIEKQLLRRNVQRLRGGLISKAHRLLCDSTPGSRRMMKKKKKKKKNAPTTPWDMPLPSEAATT